MRHSSFIAVIQPDLTVCSSAQIVGKPLCSLRQRFVKGRPRLWNRSSSESMLHICSRSSNKLDLASNTGMAVSAAGAHWDRLQPLKASLLSSSERLLCLELGPRSLKCKTGSGGRERGCVRGTHGRYVRVVRIFRERQAQSR